MRASQHVIRRPVVDEAVPEAVVETRASVTTRIDLTQLSPLVADCVEEEGDNIEIQLEAAEVRAYGSAQLPKVGRGGLAHTLRRPGTEPADVKPARALPPPPIEPMSAAPIAHAPVTHTSKTAPIEVMDAPMDTARPIDEIAEAHAVDVLLGETRARPRPRMKLGYVIAAVAGIGAAVALLACNVI